MRISLLLLLLLGICVPGAATAQSATPSPAAQPGDIQFTNHDLATLLKAVKDADTSPKIRINVIGKAPSEMPEYDPIVHFADGDASTGLATIWLMKSAPQTPTAAHAFNAAMELACMSTGFAGPTWKTIYDQVAAMDAALPPNSPNPYKYRLALTQKIQAILDSYAQPH